MKLSDWLKQTGTRRYQFAERIGVSPPMVSDYCNGKYHPRPKVVAAIVRETGGDVTANDFMAPAEAPEGAQ